MAAADTKQQSATAKDDDATRGIPYHDSETAKLKMLIKKKEEADRHLAAIESLVAKKEQEYLESTPNGNILTGFDGYIKGTGGAAGAGRRKGGFTDNDRVFSRFSIRNTLEGVDSPASSVLTTPSHAPTPANSTNLKGEASTAATPTSATGKSAGGATKKVGKRKEAGDDSETDTKENKKARTNGAGRK